MMDINGFDFADSLQSKVWWREVGFIESNHLINAAERALKNNERLWLNSPTGEEHIDLTKIYEQCKMLQLLRENYGTEKQS
jgi:hypothetical protein